MSSINKIFKVTTFGESHCKSVGVIIDGCPSKFPLDVKDIQTQLDRRKPGQSSISTPRSEPDEPIILSGVENGVTLGTPIGVIVKNKDMRKEDYPFLDTKNYTPRPSHGDLSYIYKYGVHASSGGGRSSARETVSRVIAGAIADKYLSSRYNVQIVAWVSQIGEFKVKSSSIHYDTITRDMVDKNVVRMPDASAAFLSYRYIEQLKKDGDSTGGMITCVCRNIPRGIGEPCFDKLEATLAHAMMSIPATKGFEVGSGFSCTEMIGSDHNDPFIYSNGRLRTATNHSGGIQAGISNGENIIFNVAFKPPATITKPQNTVRLSGEPTEIKAEGRHDPCVVNRAVPIVESMAAIVILDAILQQKSRI